MRALPLLLASSVAVAAAGFRFTAITPDQYIAGGGGGGAPEDYLTDLAHRWTFDSDLTDSVGSADGTALGDAEAVGGHLDLDGGSDGMRTTDTVLFNKTNVTVCMWVRPEGSGDPDMDLFSFDSHASGNCIWWIDDAATDTLAFFLRDADGDQTGSQLGTAAFVRDGVTWTHVALTRSQSGTIRTYLNGSQDQDNSTPDIDSGLTPSSRDGFVYWGIDGATVTKDFNGLMDDIRIYDAVLTAAQIEQIYDATVGDY